MLKLSKLLTGVFIAIGFSLIADGAALAQNNFKSQQQRVPGADATSTVVVETLTFNRAFDVKQIFVRAENIDTTDSSSFAPLLK